MSNGVAIPWSDRLVSVVRQKRWDVRGVKNRERDLNDSGNDTRVEATVR